MPEAATVAPPLIERGYVTQSAGNWWMPTDDEETPELRWPLSVMVYDRMRKSDAQVASVLRAVTLPIRRTAWRVDQNGARDEVAELVASDLNLPLVGADLTSTPPRRTKDRFSWPDHLRMSLLMLTFGHAFFEQQARFDDAGRARLRRLSPRMPRTIAAVNVANDGGLVSIEQHSVSRPIPVKQLVAYVNDREGGNWLGASLLRSAWKFWILKDRALRTQSQTLDRNGLGIPRYTGAEGEESLAKGLAMATKWRSGDDAGAAVPFGAKLDLVGVEGDLPDADKPIRYYDEQIARAVLAHFLNLGTATGSWALGSTFADFFTLSLQAVAEQVADIATQHVVEDMVTWNWGEEEPAPRIVFDEIGARNDALVAAIKQLVDAGLIIPDRITEEFVRAILGLPAKGLPSPTPQPAPGD